MVVVVRWVGDRRGVVIVVMMEVGTVKVAAVMVLVVVNVANSEVGKICMECRRMGKKARVRYGRDDNHGRDPVHHDVGVDLEDLEDAMVYNLRSRRVAKKDVSGRKDQTLLLSDVDS